MNPTTAAPTTGGPTRPATARPLEVVGPDGRPWTIHPASDDDTVAELARALGLPPHGVRVEGRVVAGHERLTAVPGLVTGARIEPPPLVPDDERAPSRPACGHDTRRETAATAAVEVAVIAGPAVTSWRALGPGRHVLGRSRHASIRIDDPTVEPHHGLLDVADDGTVTFRQLTGVHVARRAGRPCDGATAVDPGEWLEIGASVVALRTPRDTPDRTGPPAAGARTTAVTAPGDPWRRVLRRPHVRPPTGRSPTPLTVPAPPPAPAAPPITGLVGGLVGAVGAVVLATVLGHAGFALFALVGATASFATWAVGAVGARRRRRADRRAHERATQDLVRDLHALHRDRRRWHDAHHPSIVDALDALDGIGVAGREGSGGAGRALVTGPTGGPTIWGRRPDGPADGSSDPRPDGSRVDELRATVGVGDHPWTVPMDRTPSPDRALPPDLLRAVERCERLPGVAAPITIERGAIHAVSGPGRTADAVVRAVLVQLAAWYGPADWALAVVTCDPARWEWVRWLPHTARVDGRTALLTPSSADQLGRTIGELDHRHLVVVVTDDPDALADGTSPVRRAAAAGDVAVLAALDLDAPPPACCRRVLEVGATWRARWSGPGPDDPVGRPDGPTTGVRAGGLGPGTARDAARRLAPLVDPEAAGAGSRLPDALGLFELVGGAPSARSVLARWRMSGSDAPVAAPVGVARDGTVTIDLCRDGPHALVAGTTGSGKSELLRTIVAGLALHVGPDQLTFVLVDYKGGATFDGCARLPHTVGLVTDLDEGTAERALTSLEAELRRREHLLRNAGASDLASHRATGTAETLPRLVVVVDEFAALARDLPELLRRLVDVAQRGRSLGVHLLLATQRPAGVVGDDIRANTALRLALRLPDPADACDVVGDPGPVGFPRVAPGRVAMRLGPGELTTFQSACCTLPAAPSASRLVAVRDGSAPGSAGSPTDPVRGDAGPTQLDHLVAVVRDAARLGGYAAPPRPWREPLPGVLHASDVAAAGTPSGPPAIGLTDDPAAQAVHPLGWDPTLGNLALLGSVGAGLTSTLIALVTAWCGRWAPGELDVYVVDGHGDGRLDALAAIEHCGGVVRLHERERLHRLLRRLAALVDRGRHGGRSDVGRAVLVVDGVGPLRTALGADPGAAIEDPFDRVVREGPPVGVTAVLADHGAAAATTAWPIAERWVFHLDDPAPAAACGVRVRPVPSGVPGRLRVASSGLEAQVARGADGLAALPTRTGRSGPPDVAVLPTQVPVEALSERGSAPGPSRVARLAVGLDADDLGLAWLEVAHDEHVLVLGPARSGVSTALRRLADAWARAHGADGVRWLPVGRGRSALLDELVAAGATDGLDGTDGPDDPGGVGDSPAARLLVVDDAHRVDDARLASLVRGGAPGVTVVAGARTEAVRTAFGHWTRDVARGGRGIVMTAHEAADGELLGASLASRTLVAARPGLAWVVDGRGSRLVQVARERPASGSR